MGLSEYVPEANRSRWLEEDREVSKAGDKGLGAVVWHRVAGWERGRGRLPTPHLTHKVLRDTLALGALEFGPVSEIGT